MVVFFDKAQLTTGGAGLTLRKDSPPYSCGTPADYSWHTN